MPDIAGPAQLLLLVPLVVAYVLGAEAPLAAGLAGTLLLAIALQAASAGFNPLYGMVTLGPWLVGRVVRDRRQMVARIAIRNHELALEEAEYTRESVRYERARIARDLHDIVAHSLTVVVVQAAAGQRLATERPEAASAALQAIVLAADEAETDVELLTVHATERQPRAHAGLESIGELAQRAAVAGIAVHYRRSGDLDEVWPEATEAAYRIVQEALTNAIKHAPGAPVEIAVFTTSGQVRVEVTTGAPARRWSGLAEMGGGRGLPDMRDRAAECGGRLTAGSTRTGGWRVAASLPAAAPAATVSPELLL